MADHSGRWPVLPRKQSRKYLDRSGLQGELSRRRRRMGPELLVSEERGGGFVRQREREPLRPWGQHARNGKSSRDRRGGSQQSEADSAAWRGGGLADQGHVGSARARVSVITEEEAAAAGTRSSHRSRGLCILPRSGTAASWPRVGVHVCDCPSRTRLQLDPEHIRNAQQDGWASTPCPCRGTQQPRLC